MLIWQIFLLRILLHLFKPALLKFLSCTWPWMDHPISDLYLFIDSACIFFSVLYLRFNLLLSYCKWNLSFNFCFTFASIQSILSPFCFSDFILICPFLPSFRSSLVLELIIFPISKPHFDVFYNFSSLIWPGLCCLDEVFHWN